jgi:hypothetical protein
MSNDRFQTLRNHNRKRIGYINPSSTMDNGSSFKLCEQEVKIRDYYNSTPEAQFGLGKKEMVNKIMSQIDRNKLFSESGYLTFRFVINCHGQAGRFTTLKTKRSLIFTALYRNSANGNRLYWIRRRMLMLT